MRPSSNWVMKSLVSNLNQIHEFLPIGLVEDTVSMRVCSITNKYALMSSRFKFRQTNTFLEDETLTPEYPEVLEIGLVTGKYLIWSLVQAFAEIEPIGCMACGVDGFGPEVVW